MHDSETPRTAHGRLVTAKISPFSAHQCPIKKYGDGILEEVDGFTPQLAEGSTQQASTPGTVPCPHLGDLRDSIQPGPPACHLPSKMQTALRGDLLQEGTAAATKSLQSCPTQCDPIDGSPPASHIPGILQARILERVAISFSNGGK